MSPLLGNFLEGVSAVLSVPVEDVFIFNIQPDLDAAPGRILNVSFSAALPGGLFFPSEALEEQLYLNRPRLTSLTQMEVSSQLRNGTNKKKVVHYLYPVHHEFYITFFDLVYKFHCNSHRTNMHWIQEQKISNMLTYSYMQQLGVKYSKTHFTPTVNEACCM